MGDFYLISDLHFFHKNVIKYENRPFADVDEMNSHMINSINETVTKKSRLLILGDFAFCGTQKVIELRNKIKCENVELLMGNHDRHKSVKWWRDVGFSEVHKYPIIMDGCILSHEPIEEVYTTNYVNIHGHIHSKSKTGNYFNVSCERLNYIPILFSEIKINFLDK